MQEKTTTKNLERELLLLNRRIREIYVEVEKELLSGVCSHERLVELDTQALELKILYAEKERQYLSAAD